MSILDRLSKLLLIRENERSTVTYFFILYVCIGIGLAIGRSTAEALFFKRYGIEYLPVIFLVLSLALMLVSTLYAAFSDRLAGERMFRILLIGIGALVSINWLLISFSSSSLVYPGYFLIYEVASELLLVHASLYLGQNLDIQQLKRISPIIFAGSQIGIIIGGVFLAVFTKIIGVQNMLVIWVAFISLSTIMLFAHHRNKGVSPYFRNPPKSKRVVRQAIVEIRQGLIFATQSPLLRSMSFAMFFMVISYFTLSYSVNRIYNTVYTTEESLSAFFGILNASLSFTALLIQLFLTNRMLRIFGVQTSNLIYPITTLFSFIYLLFSFTFPAALFGSFNKDTLTASIRSPVRNIFFNALPGYIQGRARAMSIALVMPLALIVTGCLLLIAQNFRNEDLFLIIGIVAAVAYLFSNMRMNHHYVSSMINALKEKLYLPSKHFNQDYLQNDPRLLGELESGLAHKDPDIALSYARLLVQLTPQDAAEKILARSNNSDDSTAVQLLGLLIRTDISKVRDQLLEGYQLCSGIRQHAMLTVLVSHDEIKVRNDGLLALQSDIPSLQTAGIIAAFRNTDHAQKKLAEDIWGDMLGSSDSQLVRTGLDICSILGCPNAPAFKLVLSHPEPAIRLEALRVIQSLDTELDIMLESEILALTRDSNPEIRATALHCLSQQWPDSALTVSEQALEDDHPAMRKAGIEILFDDSDGGLAVLKAWVLGNAGSPRAQRTAFEALSTRCSEQSLWDSVARSRIEDAQRFAHALHFMRFAENNADAKLMENVIRERLSQCVELALFAMSRFENADAVNVIRAGLNSNDRQHIANASEILRNLSSTELSSKLCDILELGYAQAAGDIEHTIFSNLQEVLAWCRTRSDSWLIECANYTAAKTNPGVS